VPPISFAASGSQAAQADGSFTGTQAAVPDEDGVVRANHAADAPGDFAASPLAQSTMPAAAPAPFFKPADGFFRRWGKAYLADWSGTASSDPNPPQRRGMPPPLPSPPFPAADWPIGGTQEIGAPDYQTYMLQQAIDKAPVKLSRIKWYGFSSNCSNIIRIHRCREIATRPGPSGSHQAAMSDWS